MMSKLRILVDCASRRSFPMILFNIFVRPARDSESEAGSQNHGEATGMGINTGTPLNSRPHRRCVTVPILTGGQSQLGSPPPG